MASNLFVSTLGLSIATTYVWPNDLMTSTISPCGSQNPSYLTFDYIVVGAGAAGSVVANRLSENSSLRILLIEAGGNPADATIIPYFYLPNLNDSEHIYLDYKAQPSSTSGMMTKNGVTYFIGKMLGGSTSSNAMIYNCGDKKEFNSWADSVGNPALKFDNMLQYRVRMQGKVMVSTSTATDEIINNINTGFQQLNYQNVGNFNADNSHIGIFDMPFTIGKTPFIDKGERCSASRAYLQNIPSNLYVMKNSVVTKINFDDQNDPKRATGVIVTTKDSRCLTLKLNATKEVILAAGALNTPKILLQSGIGKSQDLTPFGIAQKSDLPVGENLQDHVIGVTHIAVNSSSTFTPVDFAKMAFDYLFLRMGNLTNLGPIRKHLFTSFSNSSTPDLQTFMYRFPKNSPMDLIEVGWRDEVKDLIRTTLVNKDVLHVTSSLTYPISSGTVKLRSSDFSQPPIITSGYFTDPQGSDVDQMIKAFQLVQNFVNTPAMKAVQAEIIDYKFTNCTNEGPFWSREYLNCYRKFFTLTGFHPCGTAKMGSSSDPTAVVDEKFRVKGVTNLRVVDASVFPSVPVANIQCVVYTLAEYAAEVIKQT